jgi:hypothetical protein
MTEHPAARPRLRSVQSPAPAEQPTEYAELRISVGPPVSAHGTVPSGEAHRPTQTLGIMGSTVAGIGGTVLTIRIASGMTALVLAGAELALALIAAVLIALEGARRGH